MYAVAEKEGGGGKGERKGRQKKEYANKMGKARMLSDYLCRC